MNDATRQSGCGGYLCIQIHLCMAPPWASVLYTKRISFDLHMCYFVFDCFVWYTDDTDYQLYKSLQTRQQLGIFYILEIKTMRTNWNDAMNISILRKKKWLNQHEIWPSVGGYTAHEIRGYNYISLIQYYAYISWYYSNLRKNQIMMTSSNGNIFRVTGHLCGEFIGEFPSQMPVTRSFDVFFDLCLNKRLRKQSGG